MPAIPSHDQRSTTQPAPLHAQVRSGTRRRRRRELLLSSPGIGVAGLAAVAEAGWLRARFGLDHGEALAVQLVGSVVIFSAVRAVVGWAVSRRERRARVTAPDERAPRA